MTDPDKLRQECSWWSVAALSALPSWDPVWKRGAELCTCSSHHNDTLLELQCIFWGKNVSLVYFLAWDVCYACLPRLNACLVMPGDMFLGNMFLRSWRMDAMGENNFQNVCQIDLGCWCMVRRVPFLWDCPATHKLLGSRELTGQLWAEAVPSLLGFSDSSLRSPQGSWESTCSSVMSPGYSVSRPDRFFFFLPSLESLLGDCDLRQENKCLDVKLCPHV